MKKALILLTLLFGNFIILHGQFIDVSSGASYSKQAYYTLSDDATTTLSNDSWDLAFATGFAKAGILYNEFESFGGSKSLLYLAPTTEFTDIFTSADLTDSLYNNDKSWESGAFNVAKDPGNPSDLGWGTYNPNHIVYGSRVFAFKLRNDSWKKIKIDSLAMGIYTMKYADLDGSNEITTTINTSDFSGSPFAYFSFSTGEAVASPAGWDLVFGRFATLIPGGGVLQEYPASGVLSAAGVQVAQANEVVPDTVDEADYLTELSEETNIIGHDWKYIDFTANPPWVILDDRAYFVKTTENRLWKIVFIGFEGSSTGVYSFKKEDLGIISSTIKPNSNFTALGVYPNPIVADYTVSFSLKESRQTLNISMVNSLGQTVWSATTAGKIGLNVLELQAPDVASGHYHLVIGTGSDVTTQSILLK